MGNAVIIVEHKASWLDSLPSDLKEEILSYLDSKELCRLAQASKNWNLLASNAAV